ncbi:hypothetical protein BpHYR1_007650 [Brachionus plicatilis]|uniref:Uncharacterized protein n=1 Tax=Brachionus plicatilis TaxID=10195 RepID=A0A3M7RXP2_BRAPC|nr:hypothetical protein BpHYR1_007650 [Brachionus plicatilis]
MLLGLDRMSHHYEGAYGKKNEDFGKNWLLKFIIGVVGLIINFNAYSGDLITVFYEKLLLENNFVCKKVRFFGDKKTLFIYHLKLNFTYWNYFKRHSLVAFGNIMFAFMQSTFIILKFSLYNQTRSLFHVFEYSEKLVPRSRHHNPNFRESNHNCSQ